MKRILRNEKGITLIEMLIVLAVLGILAAAVVPNLGGFLTRSKSESFDGDGKTLQTAVDSFKSDTSKRAGGTTYPVLGSDGCTGTPTTTCDSYIDIAILATEGYLSGADSVASADKLKNTTATNDPSGSYGWYVDTDGRARSDPAFAGDYP